MQHTLKTRVWLLAFALFTWQGAFGAVPTTMNAQGRLTDSTATPLPPGFKSFTFSIYDDTTGGTQIWSEASQFLSSDANGLWTATLGLDSALTPAVFTDPARWLEITVNDGAGHIETFPRVRLVTNPYAFQTDEAMHSMTTDTATHADQATFADTALFSLVNAADNDWAVDDTFLTTVDQRGIVKGASGNVHYGNKGRTIVDMGIACTTGTALANAFDMTIGGGNGNRVSNREGTVSGGSRNLAEGSRATVGGGWQNKAIGDNATIAGGENNAANANYATVAGGGANAAIGSYSTVAGGINDTASASKATVGGGDGNTAGGLASTVGGGEQNTAMFGRSTVGGGYRNEALTDFSTVGGGNSNSATGTGATVGGGVKNYARGAYSVVSGGGGGLASDSNSALGDYATVPGGRGNVAEGDYSFAAGERAWAYYDNSFVWTDGSNGSLPFPSFADKSFSVVASGGTKFYSRLGSIIMPATGVELSPGSGAWSSLSSRDAKDDIHPVDGAEVLDKVAQLPISKWRYKAQADSIHHIGPMAQDFYRLFHLGDNQEMICTVDPDGVALAAIQELYKRNQALEAELAELRELINTLVTDRSDH